jgi:hypothetical protein
MRIPVLLSDGGIGEGEPLPDTVRSVIFRLPNGCTVEVEAFTRHGEDIIQIRTTRGRPFVVPSSGNALGLGVLKD